MDAAASPAKMNPASELACLKTSHLVMAPQSQEEHSNAKDYKGSVRFLQLIFLSCWEITTEKLEGEGYL